MLVTSINTGFLKNFSHSNSMHPDGLQVIFPLNTSIVLLVFDTFTLIFLTYSSFGIILVSFGT